MRPSRLYELANPPFVIHKVECEWAELPPPLDLAVGTPFDRDDLLAYAQALRPAYDRLGRVIGQLAGLFILARLGSCLEADWPTVELVRDQAHLTATELHAIKPPSLASQHHKALLVAMRQTAEVVDAFGKRLPRSEGLGEQLDHWTRQLQVVGRTLSGCAVEALGLMPLDFSQACCNCGNAAS
jgi:hypothetical protein